MEEHLGYPKHDVGGRNSGNSRNGADSKTVRGDFGEVVIGTPRARNASFEPKVVGKRQRSVGKFSEAIISLYTRGLSTRDIEQHVKGIYGVDISPQFVSRVTEELQQQIVDWQNRPLDRAYPVVFIDGLRVAVCTDKGVLKKCVYTVLGVNIAGLRNAVESVYPRADVQLCVVHHIRNVTKFVSWKDRKALCAGMRPIYTAPTIEAAELALQRFDQTWSARYPTSVAAWRTTGMS